jgi:hypothetical protein
LSTGDPPAGYYADPSVPGFIRYWDGNEWVAGSSRPAPDEEARDPGQVPQQFTPSPITEPSPTPMPFTQPAPAPAPTSSFDDEIPESVSTMIVPSAFVRAVRSGNANSYAFPGQSGNPFAGLPGSGSDSQHVAPGEEPSAPETIVVELASPGSRILARIIDLGIAVIFSAPITITLLLIAHRHDHQSVHRLEAKATTTHTTLGMDGLGLALCAGALLALLIVAILYEGNRLSRGGQTIGRRLAGVRVVRMPEGLPLGRDGVGTRRALLFWVLAIIPVLDVFALGGMFWGRPYRQGLHEKLTSTATVKA